MSLKGALSGFLPFLRARPARRQAPPTTDFGLQTAPPFVPVSGQQPLRPHPVAAVVHAEFDNFHAITGRGWEDFIAYLVKRSQRHQAEIDKLKGDLASILAEQRFIP